MDSPGESLAKVSLRDAREGDLATISDIYNHYVSSCTCTYEEELPSAADREAWFKTHGSGYPVIVAEADGQTVAWGALSPYGNARARNAYRFTVEDSVYVRHDMCGRGVGAAILAELIRRAEALGYRSMLASISADRVPSIRLHEKFGFVKVAHFREIGIKFGRWLDVVYMQKKL